MMTSEQQCGRWPFRERFRNSSQDLHDPPLRSLFAFKIGGGKCLVKNTVPSVFKIFIHQPVQVVRAMAMAGHFVRQVGISEMTGSHAIGGLVAYFWVASGG